MVAVRCSGKRLSSLVPLLYVSNADIACHRHSHARHRVHAQGDPEAVVNVWTSLDDLPAIHVAGQDALISYGAYLDRYVPLDRG